MAKVWVVNKGNHQTYQEAEKFGEIQYLTEGRVNVFALDNLVADFRKKLANASADDYLLISGYATINGVAMHEFLKRFGKVRLLIWEANRHSYKSLSLFDW